MVRLGSVAGVRVIGLRNSVAYRGLTETQATNPQKPKEHESQKRALKMFFLTSDQTVRANPT